MKTHRIYSIKEIATLTGLTAEELTRGGGKSPIDLIKKAFYWRPDIGDREQGLTEVGFSLLNFYLHERNKGTCYQDWVSQVWKRKRGRELEKAIQHCFSSSPR